MHAVQSHIDKVLEPSYFERFWESGSNLFSRFSKSGSFQFVLFYFILLFDMFNYFSMFQLFVFFPHCYVVTPRPLKVVLRFSGFLYGDASKYCIPTYFSISGYSFNFNIIISSINTVLKYTLFFAYSNEWFKFFPHSR